MTVHFVHCQVYLAKKLKWGIQIQLMHLPSNYDLHGCNVREGVSFSYSYKGASRLIVACFYLALISHLSSNLQKTILALPSKQIQNLKFHNLQWCPLGPSHHISCLDCRDSLLTQAPSCHLIPTVVYSQHSSQNDLTKVWARSCCFSAQNTPVVPLYAEQMPQSLQCPPGVCDFPLFPRSLTSSLDCSIHWFCSRHTGLCIIPLRRHACPCLKTFAYTILST